MEHSYIIRFSDEVSRERFCATLNRLPGLGKIHIEFAEFLPDVILRGVSEQDARKIRGAAPSEARFIEDFSHSLFTPAASLR